MLNLPLHAHHSDLYPSPEKKIGEKIIKAKFQLMKGIKNVSSSEASSMIYKYVHICQTNQTHLNQEPCVLKS